MGLNQQLDNSKAGISDNRPGQDISLNYGNVLAMRGLHACALKNGICILVACGEGSINLFHLFYLLTSLITWNIPSILILSDSKMKRGYMCKATSKFLVVFVRNLSLQSVTIHLALSTWALSSNVPLKNKQCILSILLQRKLVLQYQCCILELLLHMFTLNISHPLKYHHLATNVMTDWQTGILVFAQVNHTHADLMQEAAIKLEMIRYHSTVGFIFFLCVCVCGSGRMGGGENGVLMKIILSPLYTGVDCVIFIVPCLARKEFMYLAWLWEDRSNCILYFIITIFISNGQMYVSATNLIESMSFSVISIQMISIFNFTLLHRICNISELQMWCGGFTSW